MTFPIFALQMILLMCVTLVGVNNSVKPRVKIVILIFLVTTLRLIDGWAYGY